MDKKKISNLIVIAISMLTAVVTVDVIGGVLSALESSYSISLILYRILIYGQNLFILRVLYLAFVEEKAMNKVWMVAGLILLLVNVLFSSNTNIFAVDEFRNAIVIISTVFVMERHISNKPINVGNFLFIMLLFTLVYVELQIIAQQVLINNMSISLNSAVYIVAINILISNVEPLILIMLIVAYICGNKKICTYTVAPFIIGLVMSSVLTILFDRLFINHMHRIGSIIVCIPYVLLATGTLMSWRQNDRL